MTHDGGADRRARERGLAEIAERQDGLVTRHQFLGLGFSSSTLQRRVVRGELVPLLGSAFRVAGSPESWEQRALAACLSFGPGVVLSHTSAARLWGMDGVRGTELVEVTTREGSTRLVAAKGFEVHRTRSLRPSDWGHRGNLRLTTPWRTIVDLAASLGLEDLERLVDDALARRLVDPSRLAGLGAVPRRGRRGMAKLRRAIDSWLAHPEVESVAEMEAVRLLRRRRLPPPVAQLDVYESGLRIARLDLAWPEQMVALEIDGYEFHSSRRQFGHDRNRANRLSRLGWVVLRTTYAEILDAPDDLCEALRLQLSRGGVLRCATSQKRAIRHHSSTSRSGGQGGSEGWDEGGSVPEPAARQAAGAGGGRPRRARPARPA